MRKTNVTDKHTVNYVITNLKDAYSEGNTTRKDALTVIYIYKTIAFDY